MARGPAAPPSSHANAPVQPHEAHALLLQAAATTHTVCAHGHGSSSSWRPPACHVSASRAGPTKGGTGDHKRMPGAFCVLTGA